MVGMPFFSFFFTGGCSRVTTRPVGRVESDRGSGLAGLKKRRSRRMASGGGVGNLTGLVGSSQEVFKYHGSGQVTHPGPIRPPSGGLNRKKP